MSFCAMKINVLFKLRLRNYPKSLCGVKKNDEGENIRSWFSETLHLQYYFFR